MRNDRDLFCFAGATTAPAGLEAATPVAFSYGATAVPTGFEVPFCCCCGAEGNAADDCPWFSSVELGAPERLELVAGCDVAAFAFPEALLEF
jgi:hypothetical protein